MHCEVLWRNEAHCKARLAVQSKLTHHRSNSSSMEESVVSLAIKGGFMKKAICLAAGVVLVFTGSAAAQVLQRLGSSRSSRFSRSNKNVTSQWALFLVGFVLLSVGVGQAKADFIPAITYSSASTTSLGFPVTLGSAFTVGANNITIDAVGVNIAGFNINNSLTVRLYQDGAITDLVTASVLLSSPNSTTDPRFNYVAITPIILNAGTKYEIVFDSLDGTEAGMLATGITSIPGVTFNNAVSEFFPGARPTQDAFAGLGPYFGPTFQIAAVPEPTTWALIGVGAFGAGAYAWRKKRLAIEAGMAKLKV